MLLYLHRSGHAIRAYRLLCCVALLMMPAIMMAQTSYHISTADGLSTNNLTTVIKGKDNYMWTGSYNGLHKHEGAVIRVFNKTGKDSVSISSSEMHTVFEDKNGYIWLGTTGGLDRLDPKANLTRHFTLRAGDKRSSYLGYIYSVFQDKQDQLWISTDIALFRMNGNTGEYRQIPVTKKDGSGVPSPVISYKGGISNDKGVWMHTNEGLLFYEYASAQFYHRYHNPANLPIFQIGKKQGQPAASELCVDKKEHIYFVVNGSQLIQYNMISGRLDSFAFTAPAGAWKCCYSLAADRYDNVWIGFRHGGLLFFDAAKKQFIPVKHTGINSLLRSNYVYSIAEDYLGMMWVTTNNGIDVIDWYGRTVAQTYLSEDPHFLQLDHPSGMMSYDGSRYLYIPFFKGGLFRYDVLADSVQHYRVTDTAEHHVSYVDIGRDGATWLGNRKTMTKATLGTTSINYVYKKDKLATLLEPTRTSVTTIIRDRNNKAYVKKVSGMIYHNSNDTLEKIQGYGFMRQMSISKDSQYLLYINPHLDVVKRHLSTGRNDTINLAKKLPGDGFLYLNPRDVVDDGKGNTWVASQNGVLRYNSSNDSLYVYTTRQGLSDNFTYALCADTKGRLWAASLGGIDWFDARQEVFKQVVSSPATYMDSYGSGIETKDGSIFFLAGNKLFRIYPDRFFSQPAHPYRLALTEWQVNGIALDPTDSNRLMRLQYNQNRVAFRFGLLKFTPQKDARYYYWLEGAEEDWIENTGLPMISYNALPPGRFTLHIKATDASGNLLSAEQTFTFRIRPPFWKTVWFRLLAIAIVAGIAWLMYYYRQRKQREKTLQQLAMAESRFLNLRLQMNPHFLFNSLNSIQHLVVTKQDAKAYRYLALFSHLLRAVLQNAERDFISLDTELDMLKMYLDLEAMRFKDSFTYEIIVDDNLDEEEVMVPSLLVQPFAENAIWHGLLNREGDKRLTITFANDDECLVCCVRDNGIGREKAAILKSEQVDFPGHESKGIPIVRERLKLLEQRTGKKTGITITDLYNGTEPAGTLIEIYIPFYYSEEA